MGKYRSYKKGALARGQRGDAILEALVCMFMVSIIGLSVAYSLSKSLSAHAKLNAQYSAVSQMRLLIEGSGFGLCGTTPSITIGATSVPVTVACSAMSATAVTVNGAAVDMTSAQGVGQQTMSLSATSVVFFGGSGTISVGN